MMRRALVVGIEHYDPHPLPGCIDDAEHVAKILSTNQDGSPNFECKKLLSSPSAIVTRSILRQNIEELFSKKADVVLFYFAGHGTANNLGGYLVTQDTKRYDEGVAMADILNFANNSGVGEIVIILDCCHSGAFGALPMVQNDQALLRKGISVLCASRDSEPVLQKDGAGIFTDLLCEALDGSAADVLGNVTVASVYACIDQILGAWDQRPLFKSHVERLIPLRKCDAVADVNFLRSLSKHFPSADFEYQLDPSYELDSKNPDPNNVKIFSQLQKCRAARLVEPVGEEHLYYAAINSKTCRLTPLGQFYWQLASKNKIR